MKHLVFTHPAATALLRAGWRSRGIGVLLGLLAGCGPATDATTATVPADPANTPLAAPARVDATTTTPDTAKALSITKKETAEVPAKPTETPRPRPVVVVEAAAPAATETPAVAPEEAAVAAEAAPTPAPDPTPTTRTQSGRVLDEDGKPLAGATVMLKGSHQATSTDANGNYSLEVPAGESSLLFGYGGYTDETVVGREGQPLSVTLQPAPGSKKAGRRKN